MDGRVGDITVTPIEPVRRQEGVALWRQIATRLEHDISAGIYPPGGQLPTEAVLSQQFRVNRHTVRQILLEGATRRLRNATIGACAKALGLTVNDLRTAAPRLAHCSSSARSSSTGAASSSSSRWSWRLALAANAKYSGATL